MVSERPRDELERLTQELEREHSDWDARQVEGELSVLAPLAYGHWKDDTPKLGARLRQIQRWRTGFRSPPRPAVRLAFRYLWPLGERQRNAIEPAFRFGRRAPHASHRLFVQNCSEETLREVRARLAGREVTYVPSLPPGTFAEVRWTSNDAVRGAALAATDPHPIPFPFRVDFAVRRGTRQASLAGTLVMDPEVGWVSFVADDGQAREIE